MFASLVKKVIKDTDEQTKEDIHRLKSGCILSLWSRWEAWRAAIHGVAESQTRLSD